MKKIIIALIVLIIVGAGTYYLVFNKNSASEAPTYTAPASNNPVTNTTETPTAAIVTVSIKNFSFNPPTLTVRTGTKVTWINSDSVSHTVTSDSDNLLNSPTLSPGQSFSFTFTDAGTTSYHCNIHPSMHGKVIVE